MINLTFEWDEQKNQANQEKHGVSFEEAKTVFFDENAVEFYDFDHSHDEERFLLLGFSAKLRLLLICHCYRKDNEVIRIISARRATKNEQNEYKNG